MDLLVNDKTTAYGVYTDFIATDENAALIEAVPEAAVEVDVINDTMPLLVDALKIQGKEKHGYKDDSDLALETLAKELVRLGTKGSVLAERAGRLDLYEQVFHPITYLTKVSMNLTLTRARSWRDVLHDNRLTVFTNVKAEEIAAVDGLITDFDIKHKKPKSEKKKSKDAGTTQIGVCMTKLDKGIENLNKLMFGEYSVTNPVFVEGLESAAHVDRTGIHHTGLLVMCSYENPPVGLPMNAIKDVECKLLENGVIAVSNRFGLASIQSVMQDSYTLQCTGVGLVEKTLHVILTKGKKSRVEVKMVRVS